MNFRLACIYDCTGWLLAPCCGVQVFSPLTPHPCGVSIPLLRKDVHLCPFVPLLRKDVYLWFLEGSQPGKLHCDVGCSACKDISENHCRPFSALSKPNFKKSFLSGCLHCVRNVPAKFQVCRFYSSGDFVMSEWVSEWVVFRLYWYRFLWKKAMKMATANTWPPLDMSR